MDPLLFITAVLTAISGMFAMARQYQMLQQNSYFPKRYWGWLKKSFTSRSSLALVLLTLLTTMIWLDLYIISSAIALMGSFFRITSAVQDYKKSIKPLVFTGRIKRMFAAAFALLTVIIISNFMFPEIIQRIVVTVLIITTVIAPILTILSWLITKPIEWIFTLYYINDAKKTLKQNKSLLVIGITGSYGKTSTKYILGRLLSEKYNVVITPESYNTPLGVVRTIREQLKPDTKIFVAEMGAKKQGDIKEICDIVNPKMGIITSIGPQHLETFGSIENIINTKFELADEVSQNSGKVFLNINNKYIAEKASDYNSTTYGIDSADFYAENISYNRNGTTFDLIYKDKKVSLTTKLLGNHNVQNITAAAAAAVTLGVSEPDIKYAVSQLNAVPHRLELKNYIGGSVLIDDAYNANPEGCIEAVKVLGSFGGMKKVIVTPGLVELGEREYECNYNLGLSAAQTCDVIILVGEKRAKPMHDAVLDTDFNIENLFVVKNFAEALAKLGGIADNNTAILFENDLPDNYAG